MAHDKCARFGKLITQTQPLVGPGSYDICEQSYPPRDLECSYPFLSGTRRKTFQVSKDASNLPGPGSYDPRETKRRVTGGVSIDFTDVRLKPKIYEGPGPQSYKLSDDLFKNVKSKLRSHPGTWRGPAGNLWRGPLPRSIITNVIPTIPSKNDTDGYRIDKHGILVKNHSTKSKPIDFYDVPREESNFVTLRYKGNFWSKMSGRGEKILDETPGPGAYESDRPMNCAGTRNEAFRSMKRAASSQRRYLDELWARKLLENYPAPNSYDPPKGPFDRESTCDCDKYVVEPPAFGHSAMRFETENLNDIPGPGTYDPLEGKCLPCSKICAPFGAWGSRFEKPTDDSRPGPGSYDLTKDVLAKRFFASCRRSYARPSVPSRWKGPMESIGHEDAASEYSIIDDPAASKKSRVHHAVFKSTTSRFKDTRTGIDTPAPGAYEAMKSFKASRDPCHLARKFPTSGFASKAKRFPRIPDGVDLYVPGPGIYDLSTGLTHKIKGGVVSYANERRKTLEITPGPQQYCLHPYVASSVLRRSHNVTLGKPKIAGLQEKTPNPWTRRSRGKRILRWFAKTTAQYEHCTSQRCN